MHINSTATLIALQKTLLYLKFGEAAAEPLQLTVGPFAGRVLRIIMRRIDKNFNSKLYLPDIYLQVVVDLFFAWHCASWDIKKTHNGLFLIAGFGHGLGLEYETGVYWETYQMINR
jgi:hypothetical protein